MLKQLLLYYIKAKMEILAIEAKLSYYHQHRDELLNKAKEKIPCDRCGSMVYRAGIPRHIKSNKCIYIKSIIDSSKNT